MSLVHFEIFTRAIRTASIGRSLVEYDRIGSTNDAAFALAAEGNPHGTVVLAREQTAGRGRGGNRWEAPAGEALLFSILLRPELRAAEAPLITLAAAVAVCGALRALGLERANIKWPNDVRVATRKIAGILCESRARGERIEALIVGIGLNLNQDAAGLPEGATSLRREQGAGLDLRERSHLTAHLLNRFERAYLLVEGGHCAEVLSQWESMSELHQGKRVRVDAGAGWFEATTAGLDPSGALRLVRDDGSEMSLVQGSLRPLEEEIGSAARD